MQFSLREIRRYKDGHYEFGRERLSPKMLKLILMDVPGMKVRCAVTNRDLCAATKLRLGLFPNVYVGFPSKDWKRIYDRQTKEKFSIMEFERRAAAAGKKAAYFDRRLNRQVQKP